MNFSKLSLLFFITLYISSSSIYNTSKIFAPQVYGVASLQFFLQHCICAFVDHCNDLQQDELKNLIKKTIAQCTHKQMALELLQNLENEIQHKIQGIKFQIKHKWRFDHDAAKLALIMSVITLGGYKLTKYTYQKRELAHSLALTKFFNQNQWSKGIMMTISRSYGPYGFERTTFEEKPLSFGGGYKGSNEDFIKECKKYLAVKKEYETTKGLGFFTGLFGVTTCLALSIASIAWCATLLNDPSAHNKDLPMYQNLLEFVIQLNIEYVEAWPRRIL